MTPEGKVKEKIKRLLDNYGSKVYRFMPVQNGFGQAALDYLLCVNGRFVGIEAKKPKGKPTFRQEGVIERIHAANGVVLVVNDDDTLELLKETIDWMVKEPIDWLTKD